MAQFQLDGEAFIETYRALRDQWVRLDAAQKELSGRLASAHAASCTVMGGVDFARRSAGEDAEALLNEVNGAHAELSRFLFGAHAAFEQYKADQNDGKMRFEILHPDDGSAARERERVVEVVRNPWLSSGKQHALDEGGGGSTSAAGDDAKFKRGSYK